MAGIDNTYITSYAQYREIADWCKAQGTVIDSFGNKLTPYDYIPHMFAYLENEENPDMPYCGYQDLGEYTEEYVNQWLKRLHDEHPECEPCIPLWNTDHVFDIYLIRNCPVSFIQERLKEQYSSEGYSKTILIGTHSYESIKNGTSRFDTFRRNGIREPHFKILRKKDDMRFKDSNTEWWISVSHPVMGIFDYDPYDDSWSCYDECKLYNCVMSSHANLDGHMSIGRIRRLLKRWNLPEGSRLEFVGEAYGYTVRHFSFIVKK